MRPTDLEELHAYTHHMLQLMDELGVTYHVLKDLNLTDRRRFVIERCQLFQNS